MPKQTSQLSIISKNTSSGEHDCGVTADKPLFINELILAPFDQLGAPRGRVTPDPEGNPSTRFFSLDSSNSVFNTAPPFTLSVTYDDSTFLVSDVRVV